MRKRWQFQAAAPAELQTIIDSWQLHPALAPLLARQNIHSAEAARRFFQPQLSDLHNPFLMKGMKLAVDRILQAAEQGEKILLYGDYDVDGTTSVALMHQFLEILSIDLLYYLPDRHTEGYGFSAKGVEYAEKEQVGLIICLDCGIRAIEVVEKARQQNIDVIICDHHLPEETLPPALAILDPKQADCPYPYKGLSACGVAFKLVQAIAEQLDLPMAEYLPLLDLVALSIASDIVPMTGENRLLAHFGLRQLNENPRLGLKVLIQQSQKTYPLTISDVVFGLGPRINAAGRMADAGLAVRLLLAQEDAAAFEMATYLDRRNEIRKQHDRQALAEAKALFEQTPDWENQPYILLSQPHWHKGILGIVASRLADDYRRPAIVLTENEDGMLTGSGRSIPGFNLVEVLTACGDHLSKYGGHRQAAGMTLEAANLPAFRTAFDQLAKAHAVAELPEAVLEVVAEIELKAISRSFMAQLKTFAPFGPGNQSPLFVSRQVKDTGRAKRLKDVHLRLNVEQEGSDSIGAIAFGMGAELGRVQESPFDLCFALEENKWNGQTNLQLVVKDIH